jgi:hypothetical protein
MILSNNGDQVAQQSQQRIVLNVFQATSLEPTVAINRVYIVNFDKFNFYDSHRQIKILKQVKKYNICGVKARQNVRLIVQYKVFTYACRQVKAGCVRR